MAIDDITSSVHTNTAYAYTATEKTTQTNYIEMAQHRDVCLCAFCLIRKIAQKKTVNTAN